MERDHGEVAGPDRERRLCEILAAYFEFVEDGHSPDRTEWLARYPDYADEIGRFFDDQERLLRLTTPLRLTAQDAGERPADDPSQTFRELTAGLESNAGEAGDIEPGIGDLGDFRLI